MSIGHGILPEDDNRLYKADGLDVIDCSFWRFPETGNVYRVEEGTQPYGGCEEFCLYFSWLGNASGDKEFIAIADEYIFSYISKLTTEPRKIQEGYNSRYY